MLRFPRRKKSRRSSAAMQQLAPVRIGGHANLSLELLESRIVLSSNPSLTVSGPLTVDEGTALSITNIGVFSDAVIGGGGSTLGLDPNLFAAFDPDLGTTEVEAFVPTSNVSINTTDMKIDGVPAGVTVLADVGFGSYEIAVFTFGDIVLNAGLNITATGSRPLAILSQGNINIVGTIDVSAAVVSGGSVFTDGQRIAGPGGGHGGDRANPVGNYHGSPAAGAPTDTVDRGFGLGSNTPGGGGGAFGGNGGDEGEGLGSTVNKQGFAYGDLALGIQGGSGGGAVFGTNQVDGGGGGGGIELGATGNITISGGVLANGGTSGLTGLVNGGGGGGGGILVHGTDVTVTGTLSAKGGDSDIRPDTPTFGSEGGAGGGGRILLAHSGSLATAGSVISVAAGIDGGVYVDTIAAAGVFSVVPVTSAPVIETYDYVINWGDGTADDWGIPDIDLPGASGVDHEGSLDGSHTYADNGTYEVTVTVNDSGGGSATASFIVTVDNVAPVILNLANDSAAIGGLGEGDTVTLTADFTDVGLIDTHIATIDWGDGTTSVGVVDQLAGTINADHVYAEGGRYDVTLTLVDNDTGLASDTTGTLIAGVGLHDGVLQIVGSNDDDFAKVYKSWYSNSLKVLSRIGDGPVAWESFAASSVAGIEMLLGGGHDLGFVSTRVTVDAVLDGGDGDDLLFGGNGNDVLLGGAGYDVLFGRGGRDLLIGGADSDFIVGSSGEDILVAGTTSFDNNSAARDAIMAEWTSSRDYATRVENITNSGSGIDFDNRLNEDFFLIAAGEDATVFDDEATDLLIGGRGLDLYFANLDGGVEDIAVGLRNGEILEELEAADV